MLRRLSQQAIMVDRGFSLRAVAKHCDYSYEGLRLYFQGEAPRRHTSSFEETEEAFEERVEIYEDNVERALEKCSAEAGITMPRVAVIVGPADETGIPDVVFPTAYIPEVMTKELMRKP